MRHVTLDGREMKDKETTHLYLKSVLQNEEYHGNNLDALWDVLSSYSKALVIELDHKEELLNHLGEYGRNLIAVFVEAAEENENITFQMEDA